MKKIEISGSDKECRINGENFSYLFENGHPTALMKDGVRLPAIPYPEKNGRKMKSKAKLVHRYWDSALVITKYTQGLKSIEVKYHISSDGEIKKECLY